MVLEKVTVAATATHRGLSGGGKGGSLSVVGVGRVQECVLGKGRAFSGRFSSCDRRSA